MVFHWLLHAVLLLTGVIIFLFGFLPMKSSISTLASPGETCFSLDELCHCNSTTESNEQDCYVPPTFGRVVFMLIDALRADFVFPGVDNGMTSHESLAHMKFLRGLVERNETVSFVAMAQPPTVTMPRVKALMTGSIPGFVDVVLNFDTKEVKEDSILTQLKRAGKHMVFYGDDTWIRLFPQMFSRHEGITSFYAADYTEVDWNVTRHLDEELHRTDWDLLILHYLGLDHIGHIYGPRSQLVQTKLDEMDGVVEQILTTIALQDKHRVLPSLLVLCGDHGMSDQGSHGGSTSSEISTPLVLMSSAFSAGRGTPFGGQKIDQIDLVPTLAALLGLPIPHSSLGVLAPQALVGHSIDNKLRLAYINAQQMLRIAKENAVEDGFKHLDIAMSMHRALLTDGLSIDNDTRRLSGERILQRYLDGIGILHYKLVSSLANYDIYAMLVGIATVWLVLLSLVFGDPRKTWHLNSTCYILVICVIAYALLHVSLCTTSWSANSFVCGNKRVALLPLFTVFVATSLTLLSYCVVDSLRRLPSVRVPKMTLVRVFWISTALHAVSFVSSSFVEEEHQTWYFFTVTVCVVGVLISSVHLTDSAASHDSSGRGTKLVRYQRAVISTLSVAVICRIMRAWNQTGDKWSHISDVGDWLVRPDNKLSLSLLNGFVLVAMSLMVWRWTRQASTSTVFMLTAVAVYYRHASMNVLCLPTFYTGAPTSKGITEAGVVYLLIMLQACLAATKFYSSLSTLRSSKKKNSEGRSSSELSRRSGSLSTELDPAVSSLWRHVSITWLSVMLLLTRPHNITLVGLLLVKRVCLQYSISCVDDCFLTPSTLSLVYVWFGQAAFFYQGNSNSLATIDVSAGYVGLSTYQPVMVGFLMFVNTYAGPIYWILALHEQLANTFCRSSRYWSAVMESCYTILTAKTLVVALYIVLVTIQRYHLFVWTVFSPKLLYESCSTLITLLAESFCLIIVSVSTR